MKFSKIIELVIQKTYGEGNNVFLLKLHQNKEVEKQILQLYYFKIYKPFKLEIFSCDISSFFNSHIYVKIVLIY